MREQSVYPMLMHARKERGGAFLLLIDPDRTSERHNLELCAAAQECGVDAILIGTSFMLDTDFGATVRAVKQVTPLPVIIFPGSFAQLTPEADAVLFTSLVSGRNAEYLIGEQVRGAPLVKRFGLEAIPTGYMLVESGATTSVQFVSGTMPIPSDKIDIACAHALAAQYLGMRLVYLDGGSGARCAVPCELVSAVARYIDIPVIVGGGLKSPEECAHRMGAGAAMVVVGNSMEADPSFSRLREMAAAVHPRESVRL